MPERVFKDLRSGHRFCDFDSESVAWTQNYLIASIVAAK